MSYLLYCIVRADHEEPRDPIAAMGYPRASIMARVAGLGAVLSDASRADLAPDVARLLAYAAVVEAFNRVDSVIPMRFGCRFANLAEVQGLLQREHRHYTELLSELAGRVEMSVHVSAGVMDDPVRSVDTHPVTGGQGLSYLETRRRYYALKQRTQDWAEESAAGICARALGCFARHTRPAIDGDNRGSFSIHFLVPREGVGAFAQALRPMSDAPEPSLRITGPWPPYNFVSSAV